jgi:SulP family sulfate permease
LRSDNAIYFANAEYTVEHLLERLDEQSTPVKFLLLDFQAVGFIDITGIEELRVLLEEVKSRDIQLALIGVHLPVKEVFKSSRFLEELTPAFLIENRGDAITILFEQINHEYCKNVYPHSLFMECARVK